MKRYAFHGALKAIMTMQGTPVSGCRLPLQDLTTEELDSLAIGLEQIGFCQWCGDEAEDGS